MFLLVFYFTPSTRAFQGSLQGVLIIFFASLLTLIWGIAILYRLQERRSIHLFIWILLLDELWLFICFAKRLFPAPEAALFLSLFSYGPMLFMPILWLCLVLNNFFAFDIRKLIVIFDGISLALFLLVLSNPLHHWAFYLDEQGVERHGVLYFVVYAYILLTLLAAVVVSAVETSHRRTRFFELLPTLFFFLLLVAYSVLYLLPPLKGFHGIPVLNNYYVSYTFLGFAIIETTLESGLVQNTGAYRRYFEKGPYRLALADKEYRLIYQNEGFVFMPELRTHDALVMEGFRYSKQTLSGGYLLIEEDIREIFRLQKELLEKMKRLKDTTEFLHKEQAAEGAIEKAKTRERLNAAVYSEIKNESVRIEELAASLPDTLTRENRRTHEKSLRELMVRLSFLKQRCLFIINASSAAELSYQDFTLSMDSLGKDLESLGFNFGVLVSHETAFSLEFALLVNTFLRSLVEEYHDESGDVFLSLDPVGPSLKARVSKARLFEPRKIFWAAECEEEDGDYLFYWRKPS